MKSGSAINFSIARPAALAIKPDVVPFCELPHRLKYRVLGEPLAVCQLAPGADIPGWASGSDFFCAARTGDELSIVCADESCADDRSATLVRIERGWIALKLEGPFPFSMTGVLASFLQPLAEAQIPIFAISTFDTDYVLIKGDGLERAVRALGDAGHEKLMPAILPPR